MRVLADSNITAKAVREMRTAGFDVEYSGERAVDPGDDALLSEAIVTNRIFMTKDHDIGKLVHLFLRPHAGVLLLDDLGDADAEARLVLSVLRAHGDRLSSGIFLRAGSAGVRG